MGKLYEIKGMGRGFDGLVVEVGERPWTDGTLRVQQVTRIINKNHVFGDRTVSFPVIANSLYINDWHLVPFDETPREFDSKNPNGAYVRETRVRRYDLEVVLVQYERSLTVTVLEHERLDAKYNGAAPREAVHTRYTQNYLTSFDRVRDVVDEEIQNDLEDLIFRLKDLKDLEIKENGQEG